MDLAGKRILVTGGAIRIGKAISLALAEKGAEVILHYNSSHESAVEVQKEIEALGSTAQLIQADLSDPAAVDGMMQEISQTGHLDAVINNASVFEDLSFVETTLEAWYSNLQINLTAPFQISQHFTNQLPLDQRGRIINILDWRALRPGKDHFPYTISKAALASMTKAMAVALAQRITVNGIALGAILPPSDGGRHEGLIKYVPAERWANLEEVQETVLFLLSGPEYITGEIIHLDGGRHLV